MGFQCFHVNVSRRRFGDAPKLAAISSRHDALGGAYVHEIALCVTFGAPCSGTTFRVLVLRSTYTAISNTLGTLVSETTLCVTFSARRRSPPMRLFDRLRAMWAARAAQGIRKVLASDSLGRQVRRKCPVKRVQADNTFGNSELSPYLRACVFRCR